MYRKCLQPEMSKGLREEIHVFLLASNLVITNQCFQFITYRNTLIHFHF